MVDPSRFTRRLSRGFRRRGTRRPPPPGSLIAADGCAAAALIEAGSADVLVTAASHPAADSLGATLAGARAERHHDFRHLEARSGSRAVSVAFGAALAGSRAAAFVTGPDIPEVEPLLTRARESGVPLVVHVVARGSTGRGASWGTSHEPLHALAAMDVPVLVAANAQEAADLTILARKLAEDALTPVAVAMDGPETAHAVQDVILPSTRTVTRLLGRPDDTLHRPAPSQETVFGPHRRRVPRRHDPERPFLDGALHGPRERGPAEAGRHVYVDPALRELLESARVAVRSETGRHLSPLLAYRLEDADRVLLGMGSMVESLIEVAEHVRSREKIKVGVLGVGCLHPLPAAPLVDLLRGRKTVAVLDRTPPGGGADPPLLGIVRIALEQALERPRKGSPGAPALDARAIPRLVPVFPGQDFRPGDLIALVRALGTDTPSPLFLGLDFQPGDTVFPKQRALLDGLRRSFPGAAAHAIRGDGVEIPPAAGDLRVTIGRGRGRGAAGFVDELAKLLVQGIGGGVRTIADASRDRWGSGAADRLLHRASGSMAPPSPDSGQDALVWLGGDPPQEGFGLRPDACVLVERQRGLPLWESLPPRLRQTVRDHDLDLFAVATDDDAHREDRILGGAAGMLVQAGRIPGPPGRLVAAAEAMLRAASEGERASRLEAFRSGLGEVMRVETAGLEAPAPPPRPDPRPSPEARRILRTDQAVDSLPRFWDQVGVLLHQEAPGARTPDPYLTTGILPPLSATFGNVSASLPMYPGFHPEKCTGCGACWSACPDRAVNPVLLDAKTLIEAGMQQVRESGGSADALRMAAGKLAARMNRVLAGPASPAMPVRELLEQAFAEVVDTGSLPADRRGALEEAFQQVKQILGPLPVVRTERFFEEPEKEKKGTGLLFSLALDPEACKGCGVCVAVCEPEALTPDPPAAGPVAEGAARTRLVASLPPPPAPVVARAREAAGPVAGALLMRGTRETFAGGDAAEPGSGEKIALRSILASAEVVLSARPDPVAALAALREGLGEAIRGAMARALPTGDLDALSRGLEGMDRPETGLADLSSRIEAAFEAERVDVGNLRRLVEITREIRDLEWRWSEGEGGLGRAPLGLVFGAGPAAAWAGSFPRNPFGVPVTLAPSGCAVEVARGILEGRLGDTARAALVVRRARLELDDPAEAARLADRGAVLDWKHLTAEERRLCPPLFLVASEAELIRDLGGLLDLLAGGIPLKVVMLSDLDLTGDSLRLPVTVDGASGMETADLPLAAALLGSACVARTAFSHPAHLDRSVRDALEFDGPALIAVHAPSPERHGYPAHRTWSRTEDAVASRVLTLFRTGAPGGDIRIDLDGNPEPLRPWTEDPEGNPCTPAHWALGEARYAEAFPPRPRGVETVPLLEYLDRSPEDRRGRIPVVEDASGGLHRVGAGLLAAVERRRTGWRTLQRLAGLETPPPAAPAPSEAAGAGSGRAPGPLPADAAARLELAREVRSRLLALLQPRGGNGGSGGPR